MADDTAQQNPAPQSGGDAASRPSAPQNQPPGPAPEVQTQSSAPRQPEAPVKSNPSPPKAPLGNMKYEYESDKIIKVAKIGAAVVIILLAVFLIYNFVSNRPGPVTTSTTVVQTSFNVNSCMSISRPGTYYIASNITTSLINGPCIDVKAGDVKIVGGGHGIVGNGPFTLQSSSSYGILIQSQSGINISDLSISKFSYGIYINQSNNNRLSNVTIANSTISGIYLYKSSNNQLYGNKIKSTVSQSGINITMGINNTVSSSAVEYNLDTGITLGNTTNNKIANTTMIGNPIDLACYGVSTYSESNKFIDSSCFENSHCNFAYCSDQNNQSAVAGIGLTSVVNTCGSINHPGAYELSSNLDLSNYINVSLSQGSMAPCILVNASDVYLSCNGHSIVNAHYGIYADRGLFNVTINGCQLQNDTYGIYLGNMIKFGLSSIRSESNNYGIYLLASTDGNMTNITASRNSFGLYINQTTYATVSGFHVTNNTYGISIDNSTDVYLNGGLTLSNSGTDLYCSVSTYNSTLLSIHNSQCGSTDCTWAPSCPIRHLPTLAIYPITGCATISVPGEYALQGTLLDRKGNTCFNIDANYVDFTCKNNTIINENGDGTAFELSGVNNVTVRNCKISRFTNGFVVHNTSKVAINSSILSHTNQGFNITNSTGTSITNDVVTGFINYGFSIANSNQSILYNDHSTSSLGNGFQLYNAFRNTLRNNTANFSNYGFYINNSRDNRLYNNAVFSSKSYDYYCTPNSGGPTSQYSGVDYGVTKARCLWMVEVPFASVQNPCSYINSPDTIVLTQDLLYTYGDTCFTLYSGVNTSADGTTINCAGHTIYATNGGSFVDALNTSATVENCILVGFTNPIWFVAKKQVSGILVINNTILNTLNTSIHINNAESARAEYNNITNSTYGIWTNLYNGSHIEHNLITDTNSAVLINNSISTYILNNTVNGTISGINVQNSNLVSVANNKITNSKT